MNKMVLIVVATILVGLAGLAVFLYGDKDGKDLPANIQERCQEVKDDVCALFDCMVDQCWCDASIVNPIVYQRDLQITKENQAVAFVEEYLNSVSSGFKVKSAVKLNGFFFNVFTDDGQNNESVFTVGANGKIIKTICGI